MKVYHNAAFFRNQIQEKKKFPNTMWEDHYARCRECKEFSLGWCMYPTQRFDPAEEIDEHWLLNHCPNR